jgi:hypothetical protein
MFHDTLFANKFQTSDNGQYPGPHPLEGVDE